MTTSETFPSDRLAKTPEGISILHTLSSYLPRTQNWIYPQIVGVPGSKGLVLAEAIEDRSFFPIGGERLAVLPPRWHRLFLNRRGMGLLRRKVFTQRAAREISRRHWRVNVVHAHFGTHGWYSLPLAERLSVPLVTSFYGYDAWKLPVGPRWWRLRLSDLFRSGSTVLVEGPAMRRRLIEIGCPAERVLVNRLGVDLSGIQFAQKDYSDGLHVLLVGRFTEKKGLVDGLKACRMARSRGAKLNVTIVGDALPADVAGQGIKTELLTLANDPLLAGTVAFTGFVTPTELNRLFSVCNVFLSPSRHADNGDAEGGSPVVLTQAMAAGLLCIGTRHCDIPEVVIHQKTGFLADEKDVAGLAEILWAVAGKLRNHGTMTAAGRKHVEQTFDLRDQQTRLAELYLAIIGPFSEPRAKA
jgi:colanic acid/amylovoran biosynthesis glycosyltransferase